MSRRVSFIRPGIRQAKICELVEKTGKVSVEALAERFDASQETIRRDLSVLDSAGHLKKIHGGARSVITHGEGEFDLRMRRNASAKRQIAEKLLARISSGQSLFLDTGSTTLMCAKVLARLKDLTIITNSARIAAEFSSGTGGADVYLLGGHYRSDNAQTVGCETIRQIANYQVDYAIITVAALDSQGAMDYSNSEAEIARAMIARATQVVVVADHSKCGKSATFKVCALDKLDVLLTDKTVNEELKQALGNASVELG